MRAIVIKNNGYRESEKTEVLEDTTIGDFAELIVYNDDFNTFDWVIESLIEVCGHTHEQAEQLSILIHFKGKACVKIAPYDTLKPIKNELADRGLSVVIEHSDSEV